MLIHIVSGLDLLKLLNKYNNRANWMANKINIEIESF